MALVRATAARLAGAAVLLCVCAAAAAAAPSTATGGGAALCQGAGQWRARGRRYYARGAHDTACQPPPPGAAARTCPAADVSFDLVGRGKVVPAEALGVAGHTGTSKSDCADACRGRDACRGYSYQPTKNVCILSRSPAATAMTNASASQRKFRFYNRACGGKGGGTGAGAGGMPVAQPECPGAYSFDVAAQKCGVLRQGSFWDYACSPADRAAHSGGCLQAKCDLGARCDAATETPVAVASAAEWTARGACCPTDPCKYVCVATACLDAGAGAGAADKPSPKRCGATCSAGGSGSGAGGAEHACVCPSGSEQTAQIGDTWHSYHDVVCSPLETCVEERGRCPVVRCQDPSMCTKWVVDTAIVTDRETGDCCKRHPCGGYCDGVWDWG